MTDAQVLKRYPWIHSFGIGRNSIICRSRGMRQTHTHMIWVCVMVLEMTFLFILDALTSPSREAE